MNAEKLRLLEDREKKQHWRRWGPYLAERQWGTVREDYSFNGDAWEYFPHDHARSRAYRWGEDGLAGVSDNHQRLCFAWAFWNEQDPILKERLFGLSGPEGNHGEDCKEEYFYYDNTPTHSYMHLVYKYPQAAFPYEKLVEENRKRRLDQPEYELIDSGVFADNKYFDIFIEYAKGGPNDLVIRATICNRCHEDKRIHVVPTLWFRNTWDWEKKEKKPSIKPHGTGLEAQQEGFGTFFLYCDAPTEQLFTENETDFRRIFQTENKSPYVKDAFHQYIIKGNKNAVNPQRTGTKAGLHAVFNVPAGQSVQIKLRLTENGSLDAPFEDLEGIFNQRHQEAHDFYHELEPPNINEDLRSIQRQAYAGMLWNKQFYHYVVDQWLHGDDPARPANRQNPRNLDWRHLYTDDVLSMPDSWEYPYFSSWDSAYHTLPMAMIDPDFAKRQLILLTREWYMHPNGQIPAYEWSFCDVNPPVHAWAAWRVYKIDQKLSGKGDTLFLERVFQKLFLNFTWWVNRKDADGKNVFGGGFLGLDNISVFNRSEQLPEGGNLYQSDATSWMGMYCLDMLTIALELASVNPSYEDMASKFFEHFLYIAEAINYPVHKKFTLWNEDDGFYYDMLEMPNGDRYPLKVHSMVGLIPLLAVTTFSSDLLDKYPGFSKRLEWFLGNREDLCGHVASMCTPGIQDRRILSIVRPDRLKRLLQRLFDETEFLSLYGIRSLSKFHEKHPFVLKLNAHEYRIDYEPAESTSRLFGGNSNWRGPVWFPLNMLIIESLQKFHHYFGDDFKIECPTGSGKWLNLWEASHEVASRLSNLFVKDIQGRRPMNGNNFLFQNDPFWKDYVLFYEYFNGDTGEGLGASHQTGWTGLVAKLIQQLCEYNTEVPSKCF